MSHTQLAKIGEVLIWYDGPLCEEIFLEGRVGEVMRYDWNNKVDFYVAYFASPEIQARYHARNIDLLSVMTHEETERFSFTSHDRTSDSHAVLHPLEAFTDDQLPEPDFFYNDL